jgi:hypothetical protein
MIETDIWRLAHKMIELYDQDAGWRAAQRADHLNADQCWRWNSSRIFFSQVPKPKLG